jgi:hypothetical protein
MPVLGCATMSIAVPDSWPDRLARQCLLACDGTQSDADRVAALQTLGVELDGNAVRKELPEELASVLRFVATDNGQSIVVRIGALRVLCEALVRDVLTEALRNELLSFFAGLVATSEITIAEEAMLALRPTIHLQARCAARFPNQAGLDLVAESESVIAQRIKKGKFRGDIPFDPWCYRVLRNESISRNRKLRTDALGHCDPTGSDPPDPERRTGIEQSDLLTAPFPAADIARIEGMKDPANRLIALCEPHLWRKVADNDPKRWHQWVSRAGSTAPFPPLGFESLHTQNLRMECIAKALGLTTAATKKRWFRDCLPVLSQLEFIRSLDHE